MTGNAQILAPALRTYSGAITDPERWAIWDPRPGDILVCTPPRSGTTWTQTMLVMLLSGTSDLSGPVPEISPWIDTRVGTSSEDAKRSLQRQSGRRVVKTHTPADGFPVWEGVTVIAVYRHPLDAFFSRRKHVANRADIGPDHPMNLPLSESFRYFIEGDAPPDDYDRNTLTMLTSHYNETVCSNRLPDLRLFHYSDMLRDGRRTVAALAEAAGIDASASLIDEVAEATAFGAMKSKAADYTPYAGTGFWKSDAAFFDSASSGKWEGRLSDEELELYRIRIEEQVPDPHRRIWLHGGHGGIERDK